MKTVPASDSSAIDTAIAILRSGGVVAHATETCYGFACDLTNLEAVKKLFLIKDRPDDQPVSVLFQDLLAAEKWVLFSPRAKEIAIQHLPGPLTIVLPVASSSTPLFVTADGKPAQEIGIRVSPYPIAQKIAEKFGSPIATTSANLHGQANPYALDDIIRQFEGKEHTPDLIVDSGTLLSSPPSTVVRVLQNQVTVLRQGSLIV